METRAIYKGEKGNIEVKVNKKSEIEQQKMFSNEQIEILKEYGESKQVKYERASDYTENVVLVLENICFKQISITASK